MSVRPIVLLGDPRLRLKGLPVDSFGKYLHELLDDLAHTMRDAPGVGLAAPQLGVALQACVIEVEDQLHELVNPRIVRATGDDRDLEGCLSIPGYVAYVTRRERVWVVAQDRQGKKYKVTGSGLLGRALQHELDHLDGKLYIDYLESMDELIPVGQGDEDEAEVPPPPPPAALLEVPHGALNLHPSLLPRYRGATPIPAAILAGDRETGVTLMRMDAGLDTGPIVAQTHVPLSGTETAPDLEAHLETVAAALLADNLRPWLRGEI